MPAGSLPYIGFVKIYRLLFFFEPKFYFICLFINRKSEHGAFDYNSTVSNPLIKKFHVVHIICDVLLSSLCLQLYVIHNVVSTLGSEPQYLS